MLIALKMLQHKARSLAEWLCPYGEAYMESRVLGRSGVKVAPLALGTGNSADPTPEDGASRIIYPALDAGINLID